MIVYLAGPINGCSDSEAADWREEFVDDLASALHNTGATFGYLDPMRRDYRGREASHVDDIVDGDLADIDACDVVVANCWKPSWGTAMEVFYAHGAGKKVVAVVPKGARISPWLRRHTSVIVTSMSAAVWTVQQVSC